MAESTTDRERLAAAFAGLEADGFQAKRNYWCCGTCAGAALQEEDPDPDRPYVFWHEQDEESGFDGDAVTELYLKHGPDERAADKVVAALNAVGLSVNWDGNIAQCIRVGARGEE